MITISFSSLKGGVGKTTCALNTAFALAKRGWKTLLVDLDPQGSVGLSLSTEKQEFSGFYEKITNNQPIDELVIHTKIDTFDILMTGQIPSPELSNWCSSLQNGEHLPGFFAECEEAGYDIVLMDTPSGLHGPTEGVLRKCSHVLVPLQSEPLAMRALMQMIDFLGHLQQDETVICALTGVILTMVDPQSEDSLRIQSEVTQMLPDLVCNAYITRDPLILEASSKGIPISLVRGSNLPLVALIFEQLAAELEPKLGLEPRDKNDEHLSFLV